MIERLELGDRELERLEKILEVNPAEELKDHSYIADWYFSKIREQRSIPDLYDNKNRKSYSFREWELITKVFFDENFRDKFKGVPLGFIPYLATPKVRNGVSEEDRKIAMKLGGLSEPNDVEKVFGFAG